MGGVEYNKLFFVPEVDYKKLICVNYMNCWYIGCCFAPKQLEDPPPKDAHSHWSLPEYEPRDHNSLIPSHHQQKDDDYSLETRESSLQRYYQQKEDDYPLATGETPPHPEAQSYKRPRDKAALHSEEGQRHLNYDAYDVPFTDESDADKVRQ